DSVGSSADWVLNLRAWKPVRGPLQAEEKGQEDQSGFPAAPTPVRETGALARWAEEAEAAPGAEQAASGARGVPRLRATEKDRGRPGVLAAHTKGSAPDGCQSGA